MPANISRKDRRKIDPHQFSPELRERIASDDLAVRSSAIKQAAREIGFDLVGIAAADLMSEEAAHYKTWLDKSFHADLGYLERNLDKREDIGLILPGARSVIVVACNYYTNAQHSEDSETGKISRYAWGDDYHDVIPPKLRALGELLQTADPDDQYRAYTDTGPLLEKQWARRAGIGWQGKHSNIINRSIGSWFFLGIIVSTAELHTDRPVSDHCGTCTACIDACPTDAIHAPYSVDTRRCISFWTIETKADREIPSEIGKNLDGWIFGCDICQDVCPWNRFQTESSEDRFAARHAETNLSLENIAQMSQADFSTRFRKSPVKRAKIAGLQRNARVVSEWREIKDED